MDEVTLLEELLKHYSPTHQEDAAVSFLVKQMVQMGYRAYCDEVGNAVGVRGEGPNELMLLGHIDTVPGVIEVRSEGDLLYGRGAVDAKGPLACFVCAGAQVEPPPGWRLSVIGAVGEEGSSRGAHSLAGRCHPQALVIGEPSRWNRVTLGYKGSAWFRYEVSIPQAHTAGQAESACETAVGFWNEIQAWSAGYNAGRTAAFEQVTPTLRGMDCGSDGFSENAGLKIGMRLPPGMEPETARAKLEELKGAGGVVMEDGVAAFKAEKNTALVRAFLSAIREEGGTPSFALKTGTSDMNIVAPLWKCQTVAYGPGDSSLDHTPNEHISIEEYRKAVRVLAEAIGGMYGE